MLLQNSLSILYVLVPCLELHLHGLLHEAAERRTGLFVHIVQEIFVDDNDVGHDQLFAAEKKLAELPAEERQKQRLVVEKPMLRAFWCWLEELEQQPLAGNLKKAVQYARKQQPYMENYLLDPRCQISNNLAENAIRPFTVGRKNWLFSDTVKGAKASAVIYSLVEIAGANGLSERGYLHIVLSNLPSMDFRQHPELLKDLMPWSDYMRSCFEQE